MRGNCLCATLLMFFCRTFEHSHHFTLQYWLFMGRSTGSPHYYQTLVEMYAENKKNLRLTEISQNHEAVG